AGPGTALVSTAVSRHDAPPVASAAPVAWAALLGHSPMRPRSAPDATRRATPRRPMDHPPPSRALARALELVRGLALPRGARVLALRSDPSPLAAALRESGYQVATSPDPAELAAAREALDAAVLVEFLERYPWDRWALQQVHRALKPDAALVLVTP